MSCSLTSTSAAPVASMIRRRTSAPAPITSTRPGCMTASAARCSRGIASSSSLTRRTSATAIRLWWMIAASYSGSPSASAATVVTEPASPTRVAACANGTALAGPGDRCVDVGGRGRDLLGRGWVGRQVPLGHAHAADVDAGPVRGVPGPEHELRGAPSDVDHEEGPLAPAGMPVVAPANDSAPSSSPLITSGRTPRIPATPAMNSARLDTSREADVATNRRGGLPAARSTSA